MDLASLVLALQLNSRSGSQIQPFFPAEKISIGSVRENGKERPTWNADPLNSPIECKEPIADGRYTAQFCTTYENGEIVRIIGIKFDPIAVAGEGIQNYADSKTGVAVFYDRGNKGFGETDNARFFLFDGNMPVGNYTYGYHPETGNQIQSWYLSCTLPGAPWQEHGDLGFGLRFIKWRIKRSLKGYESLENATVIQESAVKGIGERLRERFAKRFSDDKKRYGIKEETFECR